MSEFTDEEVRNAVAFVPVTSIGMRFSDAEAEKFDRWLAAHDAEVRAHVVAEEPEWEYGFTSKWGTIAARSEPDAERRAQDLILSIKQGRESGDLEYHGRVMKRAPESKPGPWVPVKQEGEETSGKA